MAKNVKNRKKPKKHHRFKKLVKLVVLAGAAYGAKKYWDNRKQSGAKKSQSAK